MATDIIARALAANGGGGGGEPVDAYTKAETNDLLATKADKNTSYTKTEVNNLLAEKEDNILSFNTWAEYNAVKDTIPADTYFVIKEDEQENPIPSHNSLMNRDANECHPINAITGLQAELDKKTDATDTDVLKARVDQLVGTVPPGSADEIADARVMVDGKTSQNLGDAIRTQVTSLKETMDTISDDLSEINEKTFEAIVSKKVVTSVLYSGYSASDAPAENRATLSPLSGYDTVSFVAATTIRLCYCETPENEYYAVTVVENCDGWEEYGTKYNAQGTKSYRVRKNDNNLPTIENPIIIPSGSLVSITVKSNETAFYGYSGYSNVLSNDIVLNSSHIDVIDSRTYEYGTKHIYVDNVVYDGWNAAAVPSENRAGLTKLNGYKTIGFITENDMTIYYDEIPDNEYFAITVVENCPNGWQLFSDGSQYGAYGTRSYRIRKSEDNLPTKDEKLVIPSGSLISFTVKSNEEAYYGVDGYSEIFKKNTKLNEGQINQVLVRIKDINNKSYKVVANTSVSVNLGDSVLTFAKDVNPSVNRDIWRITGLTCNDVTVIDYTTDIEGPVKEVGAADFCGGVHGDEQITDLKVYADGVEVDVSANKDDTSFRNLTFLVKSNVTRCNTNTVMFNRIVKIEITDKIKISNCFKAVIDGINLYRATSGGLFSVYNKDISALSINSDFAYLVSPITDTSERKSKNFTEITFYTNFGKAITIRNLIGKDDPGYNGFLNHFTQEAIPRIKVYFCTVDSISGVVYNTGDIIRTEFEIII